MIETSIFFILAAMTVIPAVLVVSLKNVFHCALFLTLSLLGVAGLYAFMAADFVFTVQLLVYAGGVMVIMLFVVLLSGKPSDWKEAQVNEKAWLAFLAALFVCVGLIVLVSQWPIPPQALVTEATAAKLGQLLLTKMVLPFEVISLVLVAALVGAVYFSVKKQS
jgi:NADH:ubiquinone oxidoreductase subunit 6 (subunit J)